MSTDAELLRQHVVEGSEAAFKEIVGRYAGLVYPAALRLVGGNGHLAEDITQDVFILLARKSPMLLGRDTLAGWLYASTRFISLQALQNLKKREIREREIIAMQTNSAPEVRWEELRPLLDKAVCQLDDRDRDAVLLRYFRGHSHREVGAALGLSENTAQVRVDRALEKLRRYFARNGVATTGALLAEALSANLAQTTPPGLIAKVSTMAHAKGPSLGGVIFKALYMTTKTKIAIITAGAVALIAAVPIELQHRAIDRLQGDLSAVQKQVSAMRAGQRKAETQIASQAENASRQSLLPIGATPRTIATGEVGTAGARVEEPADPLATLEPNLNAAFSKDPAATLSAVGAFYAKTAAAHSWPQSVDAASLKTAAGMLTTGTSNITDPAAAATTAMNMPPGRERNLAIVTAAQAWVQQDPGAASEWMASVIDTLPQEDKTQEHVIEALLPAAINEDPKTAFVWANAISVDMIRANRINDVVNVWAKTDPVGAAQAVKSANLSEENRANLLLKIQAIAATPSN